MPKMHTILAFLSATRLRVNSGLFIFIPETACCIFVISKLFDHGIDKYILGCKKNLKVRLKRPVFFNTIFKNNRTDTTLYSKEWSANIGICIRVRIS